MIPIIGAEYPSIVIPLIDGAKKNIDIIMYDWRWYADQITHPVQQFNAALVRASKRGLRVRVITNTALNLEVLNKCGIKARVTRDRRTLHCKMIIIDDETLIMGSHNITRNAFSHNIEASVVVSIPNEVTRFAEFFSNLYSI